MSRAKGIVLAYMSGMVFAMLGVAALAIEVAWNYDTECIKAACAAGFASAAAIMFTLIVIDVIRS